MIHEIADIRIPPGKQAEFDAAVSTNHGVTEPVTIRFSTPMDRRSVAATLHVEPATAVQFAWSEDDTVLTVSPLNHWAAGVFHTVTVEAGQTLSSIAARELPDMPVREGVARLQLANGLSSSDVHAGQVLQIPAHG